MYCTNCGSIVSENDNYCSICGKSISKVSTKDKAIAFYKSVIDFKYTKVDSKGPLYGEKKYLECFDGYSYTLLNMDCSQVFQERFDSIEEINDDKYTKTEYFVVKRNGKCALRTKDKYITAFVYDSIFFPLSCDNLDGYVYVKNNDKIGIIKIPTGEVVFECIFSEGVDWYVRGYGYHIRAIRINNKYGIIDLREKQKLTPFAYESSYDAFDAYLGRNFGSGPLPFFGGSKYRRNNPSPEEMLLNGRALRKANDFSTKK